MILAWLAAAAASDLPPPQPLNEASRAIEAGRLDQARMMIGKAVAAGVHGPAVDKVLADLAFRSGDMQQALGRYEGLAGSNRGELLVLERAGLAALKIGQIARAQKWIDLATANANASSKAWNASAVLADGRRDFAASDNAYHKALHLSPNDADILNNLGWSYLLRGRWVDAIPILEQAHAINPTSVRTVNNLELARAAIADDLPKRRANESDDSWAARLNDAGVIAKLQGNEARALAAFTRAIEARPVWFERAANNLRTVQPSR